MLSHDWSEFSDYCTACARSRYDAEGVACVPSTDCDPITLAEIQRIATSKLKYDQNK